MLVVQIVFRVLRSRLCFDLLVGFWLCERPLCLFALCMRSSSSEIAQSYGILAGTSPAGNGAVLGIGVTSMLSSSLLSATADGLVCPLSVAASVWVASSSSDFAGNGPWTLFTKCWSCNPKRIRHFFPITVLIGSCYEISHIRVFVIFKEVVEFLDRTALLAILKLNLNWIKSLI